MKYECDDMLKIIFKAREEELANLNKDDKNFMRKDEANRTKQYYNLKNLIEKIPENLKSIKDDILKKVEDYVETIDYQNAYFNKKYYLNGLKDGAKLMNEIKK